MWQCTRTATGSSTGNTAGQCRPHHEDMPPPVSKNQPTRRCSSSGPRAGRGAFRHGYMRTGAGWPDTPHHCFPDTPPHLRVRLCSPPDSPPASTPEGSRRRGAVRSPPRGWSARRWATSNSDRWPRAPSSWWVRPRGAGPSAGTDRARRAAGINGDQRAGRGAHGPSGQRARTRTEPVSAAHRGQSREHHGQGRAGHAGIQAPGHGGRPQSAERAGNVDHTCAPAGQRARQRLTRGDDCTCAELAMTPVKCHSQHTPCAYKGALARGICVPLRTPTAAPKSGSRESGRRRPRSILPVR